MLWKANLEGSLKKSRRSMLIFSSLSGRRAHILMQNFVLSWGMHKCVQIFDSNLTTLQHWIVFVIFFLSLKVN